ncbi:SLH domain protein isoform X2 [Wolffia australiana]
MASSASSSPAFTSGNGFCFRRRLWYRKMAFFRCSSRGLAAQTRMKWQLSAGEGRTIEYSSWVREDDSVDVFGGWIVATGEEEKKKLGFPYLGRFLYFCVGTSAALILAALFHLSLSRKGFKFHFDVRLPIAMEPVISLGSKISSQAESESKSASIPEEKPVTRDDAIPSPTWVEKSGKKRQIVSVEADSTQKQALLVFNKLKIIEDGVVLDELCTRREFARWLVKANSLLERNPRYKIVPPELTGGSYKPAFNDVYNDDPDFVFIQGLAEAGIIASKLSDYETCLFSPESFLTRLDLINWRAQLEHLPSPDNDGKMLRKNPNFIDIDSTVTDASPALLRDLLSGDQSIFRTVFGNSHRLDPHKPVTKAQAVVALASGRVAAEVETELLRRDMEEAARRTQTEEIRQLIISGGEMFNPWAEKVNEQRARRQKFHEDYQSTLTFIGEEKDAFNSQLTRHIREQAALDCQNQLLAQLREEVDQLTCRLAEEGASLLSEREALAAKAIASRRHADEVAEAKSVLEVEREALRILRRWVEEEAVKNQMRARVLEAAAQRWRWLGEDPKLK